MEQNNVKRVEVIDLKLKVLTICVLAVAAHLAAYNADLIYDDEPALLRNADVQVWNIYQLSSSILP